MIALNELMKNRELFEKRYKLKGLKVNLDQIFLLEEERKVLQLKTEAMRAECNKLCGSIADLKKQNKNTSDLLEKITRLDNEIKKNNIILAKQNKHINKLLTKLHNLPDNENTRHLQLDTINSSSSLADLEEFLKTIAEIKTSKLSIDKHLKSIQNMILRELPQITKCKIGYEILTTLDSFDDIKNKIMQYFIIHSEHVIEVSCKKLYKSNTASYLVHLNRHSSVYLEVIREFKTRENKIKYHDKTTDMTKFANQINIIIKFRLK